MEIHESPMSVILLDAARVLRRSETEKGSRVAGIEMESGECARCLVGARTLCRVAFARRRPGEYQGRKIQIVSAERIIVDRGSSSVPVVCIGAGVAASVGRLRDGRTQILALHFPGDIIGGSNNGKAPSELRAVQDCQVCTFDADVFSRFVESNVGLRSMYLERASDDLRAMRQWMTVLGKMSARERVASYLLLLKSKLPARSRAGKGAVVLDTLMSRQAIGNYLGLTLETVSRSLRGLESEGRIRVDGRYVELIELNEISDLS